MTDNKPTQEEYFQAFIGLIVLIVGGYFFYQWYSGEDTNKNDKVLSTIEETDAEINEVWKTANTIDDVKKCITGTWISTPPGNLWFKIIVNSDKTWSLFSAWPSDGNWNNEYLKSESNLNQSEIRGRSFNIREDRYSDTGQKYIEVEFYYTEITREENFETGQIEVNENKRKSGSLIFGDDGYGNRNVKFRWGPNNIYEAVKGDFNPWNK